MMKSMTVNARRNQASLSSCPVRTPDRGRDHDRRQHRNKDDEVDVAQAVAGQTLGVPPRQDCPDGADRAGHQPGRR